ncbi:hypothetical protein XENORESO_015861 [Xenotaenia resolanae]|uniref:Maturase K n=1 Tax=Xenotaenia resolanae TaxID=208358 RepID=A0ABV0WX28_9TELE
MLCYLSRQCDSRIGSLSTDSRPSCLASLHRSVLLKLLQWNEFYRSDLLFQSIMALSWSFSQNEKPFLSPPRRSLSKHWNPEKLDYVMSMLGFETLLVKIPSKMNRSPSLQPFDCSEIQLARF